MTDLELYNAAKEAYYAGSPIMEDFEFDALEERLGLSNKSYVGTRHNPSYTVKHPFIMGSLSKVQIHKDKEGNIHWDEYLSKAQKFFKNHPCIITPKFDGCSFEIIYTDGAIESISTRGDGEFGKDIKSHILPLAEDALKEVSKIGKFIFRGEVLINKQVFEEKYSEFVNPRSFVAGILNRDFTSDVEDICKDLSIVIYDTRNYTKNFGWRDIDWVVFSNKHIDPALTNAMWGSIDEKYLPQISMNNQTIADSDFFSLIYKRFEDYRNNECQFALDGIVIKPIGEHRINNLTEHRPSDCVAIKFIPMLEETEVIDITWKTGKTNELTPVVIVKPVTMDGKSITKASGHNYGYLIDKKISVGSKIVLSLAGDIIPFIYKITDTSKFDINNLCIPDCDTEIDGCHLLKIMTEDEIREKDFLISAQTLNIPGIGPSAAKKIYDYLVEDSKPNEFFNLDAKEVPNNILLINSIDIDLALGGKLGKTGKKEFEKVLSNLSLKDIILSLGYSFCGGRVAEEIEKYLCNESYDWTSLAGEGYEWALDTSSIKYKKFESVLNHLNMTIEDFKKKTSGRVENAANQIPVILTGEPNNYLTKQDFLNHHPEYRVTGSWKEVQIVFTNSLESNTGKMKQAKAKGIKIELY